MTGDTHKPPNLKRIYDDLLRLRDESLQAMEGYNTSKDTASARFFGQAEAFEEAAVLVRTHANLERSPDEALTGFRLVGRK